MNVKRISMLILLAMTLAAVACAQQSSTGAQNTPPSTAAQPTTPPAATDQEKKDQDKKAKQDKKKKDKKDKNSTQQDVQDTSVFSQREANDVLGQIRDGLEGHSQRLMLGAFDGDNMDGYLSFEDQIEAFFNRYEGFRVNIRIIQSSVEGNKGIVTASFQMEATPRSGNPLRREGQLRFELEHGKKGWKVVDVSPRSFFQ